MNIFSYCEQVDPYEQVVFAYDNLSGLKAIIAIHNTNLGPALGGTRMYPYEHEEDALQDVLRLSRGMTYKAAAAGLNLGGGKGVIIADPRKQKTEKLLQAYGWYVDGLSGRYITAPDMGTCQEDMDVIIKETSYVTGTSKDSGDPSPFTAYGVYKGIKAAVEKEYGRSSLKGLVIVVQGLGNVGYNLCRYLYREDATLVVTDFDKLRVNRAVREFQASPVSPGDILNVECDIFAPCAMGGVLNSLTIPYLKCRIISGAANNVLEIEQEHAEELYQMGIVYVPDYIINAGGLISVSDHFWNYNREYTLEKIEGIYDTVLDVLSEAERENISPFEAANQIAYKRVWQGGSA